MELEELDAKELLDEHRQVSEFRGLEQAYGQVSPKEINLQRAIEDEILRRLLD